MYISYICISYIHICKILITYVYIYIHLIYIYSYICIHTSPISHWYPLISGTVQLEYGLSLVKLMNHIYIYTYVSHELLMNWDSLAIWHSYPMNIPDHIISYHIPSVLLGQVMIWLTSSSGKKKKKNTYLNILVLQPMF